MEGFTAPLVTADWLSKNLEAPDLIILNATIPKVTGSTNDDSSQIQGARFFDIKRAFSDTTSSLPNTFPSAAQFEKEAQKLGVNTTSFIVVYDDHGMYSGPRAWWLFKSFGHKNIAVLDGGLPAWKAAGFPVEIPKPFVASQGNFKANYQEGSIKGYKEILKAINSESTSILDARSSERFRGTMPEPREGLRSGHIPNSINLPYADLLEDGRMLQKDALIDKFKAYSDKKLMFSCGTGITACILALGAELAGHKDAISVYDGSWTEWGSRRELPIET
ncbi:MAG: sulfurtransferase [Flavobacteriaceae bacterium]|nr:sulfurtransferase [Flavobacteriaceae bacterium]